ncbi:transient receptor potential cation channel protein painless-like [Cochliomyia hominivorax]
METAKPEEMTNCLIDPQVKLAKALHNRDIREFRVALSIGANPLASDDRNLNTFEKALQSPGCWEFIRECLKNGCDPNYINNFYNKTAINFVIDSRDPLNLRELLSSPGVKVDYKYSDLTPLNSLAKNLNNENADNVVECMKVLLRYGASPNIPDQREMTPLHNVIKNRKIEDSRKYEIVQMFLSLKNIDIDTYREGELRKILEKEYPLMELPEPKVDPIIKFHTLISTIRKRDMETFEKLYNNELRITSEDEEVQLLVAAIEFGAHKALDLILANGVDYNKTVKQGNIPVEIAWIYGNWYALEKLLQQPNIKLRAKDQPLSSVVRKLNEDSRQDFCNYWKCFYVLLESDKIDINAMDLSKSTALHYAVKYRNNKAVRELLRKGACISVENTFHELPLYGMNPAVWEAQLDACITSSNDELGDKNFEILISFKNFMTSQQKRLKQLKEVLTPIAFMAETKEFRPLLQHPVITSILYLKWHKLSLIFYINFLLYLYFAFAMITHAVLKYREPQYEMAEQLSRFGSYLGILYLILRELLQFIISPLKYLKSITNYIEILLIICSLLICYSWSEEDEEKYGRNIAVICILLLAYELAIMVGSLPISAISTHMLMLKAVCKSFLKGFLLYSIFILTFTLCFYIKSEKESEPQSQENDENYFHKFSNPLVAFAKTMVMFTGEFDAGSLNLGRNYPNYLLFLSFVFFMTIILFNLLNGLAVSDTQAIKDQAELNDIICRTNILYRYEKAAVEQTLNLNFLLKRQPFRGICRIFSKLYPDYTTDVQISILPNNKNRVISFKDKRRMSMISQHKMPNKGEKDNSARISFKLDIENALRENGDPDDDDDSVDDFTNHKYLKCWFSCFNDRCSRIDKRTVSQAMAVLEKKSSKTLESRLEMMEQQLNKIINKLEIQENEDNVCASDN